MKDTSPYKITGTVTGRFTSSTPMNTETKEPLDKLNISQLNKGDRLSRTSYMEVIGKSYAGVAVRNETGMEWNISEPILRKECYSANQFTQEQSVTRSQLIQLFTSVGDTIYTVNYNKQPKVEDAYEEVANKGKLKSNAEIKKALKEKMKGEERTLIGYTLKADNEWGRSMVIDLEQVDPKDRIRQVDHRTLNWLIWKNTKYTVKG